MIIQTEKKFDYADFPSALEAVIESLRARIEEEGGDPDDMEVPLEPKTHLEKVCRLLRDLEDDAPEDWESYTMVISQPCVYLGEASQSTQVNLAKVEGRDRAN